MKKYDAPQIKVMPLNMRGSVLLGSWDSGDKAGIFPSPGGQNAFG